MDNVTHTLTALALSHVGLKGKTRFATVTLIIGSNLPDVDIVTRFGGSVTYLKYHRGISHSLVGATILAALLFGLVYYLGRKAAPPKRGPLLNGPWLFTAAWIATASHVLLDFTNHYGIRPFLPFSGRWYAWDIMFILDPVLWGLLAAGLGLPALFRLISEEVGAKKPGYRRGAIFSLCCLLLLWGVRDVAHRRVLTLLDSHTYRGENSLRRGAFPSPANPFEWTGVVETDSALFALPANALESDADPEQAKMFRKPEASAALDAALKTRTGITFSNFARFLWPQVAENEDGFTVTLQDLRFFRRGFVAEIELDKNLRVRSESFSFTAPTRAARRPV